MNETTIKLDQYDGTYYLEVHVSRAGHYGVNFEIPVAKEDWDALKAVGIYDLSDVETAE